MSKRSFVWALSLALLAAGSPVLANEKTEDQLIAELASPNEGTVTDALLKLEKQYPTSTKAFPTMKKLLKDRREKVRRKAARVLGVVHADVDEENLKDILSKPITLTLSIIAGFLAYIMWDIKFIQQIYPHFVSELSVNNALQAFFIGFLAIN